MFGSVLVLLALTIGCAGAARIVVAGRTTSRSFGTAGVMSDAEAGDVDPGKNTAGVAALMQLPQYPGENALAHAGKEWG